jgi:hypothetical protein
LAPVFLQKPENIVFVEESTSFVEAIIDGMPFPQCTWYKGDREIHDSIKMTTEVNQTTGVVGLTIKKLKPEDEAKYTLKINNIHGEDKVVFSIFVKCMNIFERNLISNHFSII